MVHKAKSLVKSGGILSTPNPIQGHGSNDDKNFFLLDFLKVIIFELNPLVTNFNRDTIFLAGHHSTDIIRPVKSLN